MSDYRPENLARLEPEYLSLYHMQSAPFAATHEDRFLYLDAARNERLALLNHMTQFSNLLLIVMGEAGVGKTSLLQRFVATAQVDWRICQISANTMMDAEQLLFTVAQGFGLQQLPSDAAQLQEMVYARLATLHRQEQVPILIIHAAHTLPKEALLAVFNLADAQVEQGNLIRIILSCEPQIEKILQAKDVRALRERITHTMEILPFDEVATAEYLKHRMAVAGFDGITPFTPKVVKKIFKLSHGIPARINEQAHQILMHGDSSSQYDESVPAVDSSKRSYKTMVMITLAAVVAVIVFVYQDQINTLFDDKAGSTTTAPAPVPVPAPPVTATQEKIIPLTSVTETPSATATTSTEFPVTPPRTPTAATPVATPTPAPVSSAPLISVEVRSLDPAALVPSTKPQSVTLFGQGFTPESQVLVSWSGHEKMLKSDQVKFINDTEMRMQLTTGATPDKWAVQVIDPHNGKSKRVEFEVGSIKPLPGTTVAPVTEQVGGIHTATWIKQQSAQHYTLQLFGSRSHTAAQAFIQQHKLRGELAIFHTHKQGGDWYSVILGSYTNQQTAQQASSQLPLAVQKAKPWVRRFDAIQAEMTPDKAAAAKPSTSSVIASQSNSEKSGKPAAPVTATPGNSTLTQHEAWLWSQDPRHFTLQLLVSQSSDNVERFINQHAVLRAKAVYFRTHSKDRELFTVVFGVYATQPQAEAAAAQLPADLRSVKPHIRTYGSIHAELDRANKPKH